MSTVTEIKAGTMNSSARKFNFSAGPATLPESVIEQAQQDLWSIHDSGIGIMEHSHRGPVFTRVIEEAQADCRAIANIGDDYEILFLQGGATTQFTLIPMNFLGSGRTADYAHTGVWTKKAVKEARQFGPVNLAFDGTDSGFDHTPSDDELKLTPDASYFHYCSNNTIYGTEYPNAPSTKAPLIADMSSDIFSRPLDINAHSMIYAGAQKNLGPSGTVLAIIRKSFLETANDGLPLMFDYRNHAAKGSCLNTPPTFGIYMMGQVFKWILREGGLDAFAQRNRDKAGLIYEVIDSGDFYSGVSLPECRSLMNISFRTPSPELDAQFIAEAKEHDMDGLKGHRDVGGLRASIYNAFPKKGCEALSQFMKDFAAKNG